MTSFQTHYFFCQNEGKAPLCPYVQLVRALLRPHRSFGWKEPQFLSLVHIPSFSILQIPRRQIVGVTMLMLICSQAEASFFRKSAKEEVVTMETSQVEQIWRALLPLVS